MTYAEKGKGLSGQRGVFLIAYAALFLLLISVSGIIIDVGMIYNAKSELKKATDSAALAGALDLNKPEQITSSVQNYLALNPVLGTAISDPTVTLGVWNDWRQTFDTDADSPTAVQVTAHVTGHYFFARIFNLSDYTLTSTSIASVVDNRPLNIVAAYDEQPMNALENAISYLQGKLDSAMDQMTSLPIGTNNLMAITNQAESSLAVPFMDNEKKVLVLLANGTVAWGDQNFDMSTLVNTLKQERISVFRLVLGTDSYPELNQQITTQTGGSLYNAPAGNTDYTEQMDTLYDDLKKGPPRLVQ